MHGNLPPRLTLPNLEREAHADGLPTLGFATAQAHASQEHVLFYMDPVQVATYFIASSSNAFARSRVFMSFDMPARRMLFNAALT